MGKANGGGAAVGGQQQQQQKMERGVFSCSFRMPLHYPRYKKADYEAMPEWRVDCLLREYGLPVAADVGDNWSVSWPALALGDPGQRPGAHACRDPISASSSSYFLTGYFCFRKGQKPSGTERNVP
jgi:hypothetical protein